MKLYHGSNIEVLSPEIIRPNRRLDFGPGFYLTSCYEQAEKWAYLTTKRKEKGSPSITVFDFNEEKTEDLILLKFANAEKKWLQYVSNNRNSEGYSDSVDLVIGPVANDRTMFVLQMYFSGIYDEDETIKRLLTQNLHNQYSFKTERALRHLDFKEALKL